MIVVSDKDVLEIARHSTLTCDTIYRYLTTSDDSHDRDEVTYQLGGPLEKGNSTTQDTAERPEHQYPPEEAEEPRQVRCVWLTT